MTEEPWLHVLGFERAPKQWVVEQIDLPDGQVVRSTPVRVEQIELVRREWLFDGAQ
jgi:hypothetical protein